jgi:2-aminobenzoate-CoA ligase
MKLDCSFYVDHFARESLPPEELWPAIDHQALAELAYPKQLNAGVELLDKRVAAGFGGSPCVRSPEQAWSYAELLDKSNRIARILVEELGLAPGNRVLLRSPNTPMLAACWFGVLKAGGIVVTTMPLLRARELGHVVRKAKVHFALCDARIVDELQTACRAAPDFKRMLLFNTADREGLESRMAAQDGAFENVIPSHDDVALIAFTSGTTGPAKGTLHFHRDILVICDRYARLILNPAASDVFSGSPPLAFTFGLGGLLLFPMRFGASTVLLERCTAETLLDTIEKFGVTTIFTAPTLYRVMTPLVSARHLSTLKMCVSSGEHLPLAVFDAWLKTTGIKIIDGIGSTEMLHTFIAVPAEKIRPGATGKPFRGYTATVVDKTMKPLPPGKVGLLAVRGPTGCRYLDDVERQKTYVRDGWNLTGDAFSVDDDGYFWYHARVDDMIISAGYNISGTEIEEVLLEHPKVRECAVLGVANDERGQIVKAFVVLRNPAEAGAAMTKELQELVKASLAPYKYPREIAYLDALPRTETGKVQRNNLRNG